MPAELEALSAQLERLGFTREVTEISAGFGDRVEVLEGPELAVRIVADRGQWFLEAAGGWAGTTGSI
jgi:hypothetical protein